MDSWVAGERGEWKQAGATLRTLGLILWHVQGLLG